MKGQLPLLPPEEPGGQSAEGPRVRPMGAPATIADPARRKELGAFYTPPAMADALVQWAVRSASDRVLDPSFGGLVFLRAAQDRLLQLGAQAEDLGAQIHGLEVDRDAYRAAIDRSGASVPPEGLLLGDFFAIEPGSPIPQCDAVIGNPPYIRYQDFKRSSDAAHRIAKAAGARLTRLASSWAPFLIHAAAFVAPGGRMAQVLPAELLHAQYAGEVTEFLRRRFARLTIAVFDERVFPGALEEVVLLFADGRGEGDGAEVQLMSCRTLDDLDLAEVGAAPTLARSPELSRAASREKLLVQLLPSETQDLYRTLEAAGGVSRLGTLADVGIGAVTGANDFFLLAAAEADGLAPDLLRPAVSKAAQIRGARFRPEDHERLLILGRKAMMFVANGNTSAASLKTARSYIRRGREAGIDQRYKCRVRDAWWAVPLPKMAPPDMLLTYCANKHPRLAVNEARVVQTNTIHGVALSDPSTAPALAASFYNSLTMLSAELVGRSYGGGVLKLEPTEAEAVLVPPLVAGSNEALTRVDALVRSGEVDAVLDYVDRLVLGEGFGLSDDQIGALRSGAERLRVRRKARGKPAASPSGHVLERGADSSQDSI